MSEYIGFMALDPLQLQCSLKSRVLANFNDSKTNMSTATVTFYS